jgi:hypothetical protein
MSFPIDDSKLEAKHLIQKINNGPKDRYHMWRRTVEFALRDTRQRPVGFGNRRNEETGITGVGSQPRT